MPNGGPDCCGTCWYNNANIVSGQHSTAPDEGMHFCTIRQLHVAEPFWTYCFNHRDRAPGGQPVPFGPAYRHAGGYPYKREPLGSPPDSAVIRDHLLSLLEGILHGDTSSLPGPVSALLDHLEAIREFRALPLVAELAESDHLEDWGLTAERVDDVMQALYRTHPEGMPGRR